MYYQERAHKLTVGCIVRAHTNSQYVTSVCRSKQKMYINTYEHIGMYIYSFQNQCMCVSLTLYRLSSTYADVFVLICTQRFSYYSIERC